jgi:hypothetical protein
MIESMYGFSSRPGMPYFVSCGAVGHNESDTGEALTNMPFHFSGNYSTPHNARLFYPTITAITFG